MNQTMSWLARLCVAGAGLAIAGCGGGGVPDPASDTNAASDAVPSGGGNAPVVVAANEAPKAEAKDEEAAPVQGQEGGAPAAPAPPAGGSTTSEMLAMATGPAPGSNQAPAGGATPPPGNAQPGQPAASGDSQPSGSGPARFGGRPGFGPPAGGGPGGGPPGGGPAAGGPSPGPPGGGVGDGRGGPQPGIGRNQDAMANARRGMANAMQNDPARGRTEMGRFGPPGGGGGPGGRGLGGAPGDDGPGDFHSPTNAVKAFLSALKAKDADRLSESTALRAALEASSRNQPLFEKILALTLSDTELDDLAKKLEGFTVAYENPPKSTARVEVILQKTGSTSGGYIRRTVTVRHEKKGWGVCDIGGPSEFKMPGAGPTNRARNR